MSGGDGRGVPRRWPRLALALVALVAVGWLGRTLVDRHVPEAPIGLVADLLAANEFERAQQALQEVHRSPGTAAMAREEEAHLLARAAGSGRADDWFMVAFHRDLRGDRAGAFVAFRTALHRGLAEPRATYARAAMERLAQ
jgi:hypothetical protein